MKLLLFISLFLLVQNSYAGCCGVAAINERGFANVTTAVINNTEAVVNNTSVLLGAIEANTYAVDRTNLALTDAMTDLVTATDVARSQAQEAYLRKTLEKIYEARKQATDTYGKLTPEACARMVLSYEGEKSTSIELAKIRDWDTHFKTRFEKDTVDPERKTFATSKEEDIINKILALEEKTLYTLPIMSATDLHWDEKDIEFIRTIYEILLTKEVYPSVDNVSELPNDTYTDPYGPYNIAHKKLMIEKSLSATPFLREEALMTAKHNKTDLESIPLYKDLLAYMDSLDEEVKNSMGVTKESSDKDKLSDMQLIELLIKANMTEPDKIFHDETANMTDLMRTVNYNLTLNNFLLLQLLKTEMDTAKLTANMHDHVVEDSTGKKVKTLETLAITP